MELSELNLDRQLYKNPLQDIQTKDAVYDSSNVVPVPVPPLPAGGAAGDINVSNVTINGDVITPGTLPASLLDVSNRDWVQTCVFSPTDADTVSWTSGVFTSADGTNYAIGAGNTGNMAAKTYIYLDLEVSATAYQITTSAATAVGAGKVLVAIAQNGTTESKFMILNDNSYNIDAANIVANSITANELAAAILYAGSLIIDTSGLIRSGQTDYDIGTGWWLGNAGGTSKFSIGNPAGNKITWDGTILTIIGELSTFVVQDIGLGLATTNSADIISSTHMCTDSTGTILFIGVKIASISTNVTIYRLLKDNKTGTYTITHSTTLSTTNDSWNMTVVGSQLYVSANIAGDALRRYSTVDLSGVTTVTFSGTSRQGICFSDGTNLYITSGTDTFDKFTISGTVATNNSTITYTSSAGATVASNGTNVWIADVQSPAGTVNVRKYVLAGGTAISTTTRIFEKSSPTELGGDTFIANSTSLGFGWSYQRGNTTNLAWRAVAHLTAITLP